MLVNEAEGESRTESDTAARAGGQTEEEHVSRCGSLMVTIALVSLVAVPAAWAPPGETIHLLTHPFNPADGEPAIDSWLTAEPPSPGEAEYYLVQLAGASTPERKAAVQALGGELVAYVPDNTWITRIEGSQSTSLRGSPEVAWVGAFHPAYKISPTIGTHEFKNPKRAGDSFLTLHVRVFDDLPGTALTLEGLGAEVLETNDDGFQKLLVVHASRQMVNAIARVRGKAGVHSCERHHGVGCSVHHQRRHTDLEPRNPRRRPAGGGDGLRTGLQLVLVPRDGRRGSGTRSPQGGQLHELRRRACV
jgi:hypothetical protein